MKTESALIGYRVELASADKAEGTIKLYYVYLNRFAAACPTLEELNREVVSALLASLGGQVARNNALKALRGFLAWCVRMDYTDTATVEAALGGRKYKRKEREPKYYIPAGDFQPMLTLAETEHPYYRAVLGVALFTLARQSELVALKLSDVNLTKGEIQLYREKRDRWTTQPIGPDLYGELDRWLLWYAEDQGCGSPAAMMHEHPEWPLLPFLDRSAVRDPATGMFGPGSAVIVPERKAEELQRVVKVMLDALGVSGRPGLSVNHLGEGMHTIRRSGARAMADWLIDVVGEVRAYELVRIWLDHEDVRVTMEYIGQDAETKRLHELIRTTRMYEPSLADSMPAGRGRLALVR